MIDPYLLALGAGALFLVMRKPAEQAVDESVAPVGDSLPPIPVASMPGGPNSASWDRPPTSVPSVVPGAIPQFTYAGPIVTQVAAPASERFGGGGTVQVGTATAPVLAELSRLSERFGGGGTVQVGTATAPVLAELSRLSVSGTAISVAPGTRVVVGQNTGVVGTINLPPRPLEILRAQGLRSLYDTLSRIRPALNTYNARRRAADQALASSTTAQWSMYAGQWQRAKDRLAAASRLSAWLGPLAAAEVTIRGARDESSVRAAILPVNTAASSTPRDISLLGTP